MRLLDNEEKSDRALRAITLIKNHQDIFDVEISPASEKEISTAFADPEILNSINKGRLHRVQVLITNDNNLNGDAQRLNDLRSCSGKQVYVVYLDATGSMRTNKSLKDLELHDSHSKNATTKIGSQQEIEASSETQQLEVVPNRTSSIKHVMSTVGKVSALVIFGIAIDKYGDTFLNSFKKQKEYYER